MKKLKVCIIGAGNISNTRHIPALLKIKNVEIIGVVSDKKKNLIRTQKKYNIPNELLINNPKNDLDKFIESEWFKEVDAVVIGVPPHQHYFLSKIALTLSKHVLVEKPMMMNTKECDELIKLASQNKKVFSVMHNFQFATDMEKLTKIIKSGKEGAIQNITEIQFTNRKRRLPDWYNELPLGLFYDEAAHFIYLLEKHAGSVKIKNVYATYTENKEATPSTLSITATANKIPVQMLLNMNAPICEWLYIVNFKENLYYYDFFKDILIRVPSDKEHYSLDVLKTDILFTLQYWLKFIRNGFKMITGNLLYGHDKVLKKFVESIINNEINEDISAYQGRKNVKVLNLVIEKVNKI